MLATAWNDPTVLAPFQYLLYGLVAGVVIQFFVVRRLERALEKRGQTSLAGLVRALRWSPLFATTALGLHETLQASALFDTSKAELDRLLEAATILVFTGLTGRLAIRVLRGYLERHGEAQPAASLLISLTQIAIWSLGLLLILQAFSISITPLLTALGVGGLAVALALQDTLSNLFAGLQVIASKQLRPGDYVRLEGGDEGIVTDITWRNTTIRDFSNNLVVVPNIKLAQSIFTNHALPNREVALAVPVLVPYGSDLEKVERLTFDLAQELMREGGFEPFVRFTEFGNDNVKLAVWLRAATSPAAFLLRSTYIKQLHARFLAEGIPAPFPASAGDAVLAFASRLQRDSA